MSESMGHHPIPASAPSHLTHPPMVQTPSLWPRQWKATRWAVLSTAGLALVGALTLMALTASTNPVEATASTGSEAPHVDGDRLVFSKSFAERIGLTTTEVKLAELTPTLSVVGSVTYDPHHVARIGTRLRGLVRTVEKFEGAQVKAGELLASVDSPELGEAQTQVSSLRAQKLAAERNAQRERDLASRNLTTRRELESSEASLEEYSALLQAAQQKVSALGGLSPGRPRALGTHHLVSPLSGTVVARKIAVGQLVEGEEEAFRVANLDHLWVELDVYERHLTEIQEGAEVVLSPLSAGDLKLPGRVAHVGAEIDQNTRTATVRIEFDNKERLLRPGQAVTAVIHAAGNHGSVPLVPRESITFVDGEPIVFVAESPGRVGVTRVQLGASDADETEVKRGLRAGQRVVVKGVFALKSELFR